MSNEAHVQTLLDAADSIRTASGDTLRRVNAFAAVKRAYEMGGPGGEFPCHR